MGTNPTLGAGHPRSYRDPAERVVRVLAMTLEARPPLPAGGAPVGDDIACCVVVSTPTLPIHVPATDPRRHLPLLPRGNHGPAVTTTGQQFRTGVGNLLQGQLLREARQHGGIQLFGQQVPGTFPLFQRGVN